MKIRLAVVLPVLAWPALAQEAPPVRSALYWADVDRDGLQDALAIQPDGSARLLLNLAGGDFLDATEAVGLAGMSGVSSAAWSDVDGDGRTDLYLAAQKGPSRLLLQTDEGTFADVTAESGLPLAPGHVHAEWFDFDADGRVDLNLVGDEGERLYRNLGRARFEPVQLGLSPTPAAPAGGGTGSRGKIDASVTPGASSPGGAEQSGASFLCLDAISDQSSGLCLQASTLPTIGSLYPLGPEFNIDSLGRVGIGTTTPGMQLDVAGDVRASGQLVSTATIGAPLAVASSQVVPQLNADMVDGLEGAELRLVADPITLADLAADSVDSSKILDGSIGAADLAPNSVGEAQLQNASVGNGELQNDAVHSLNIIDGTVASVDINDGAITADDLAAGSVGSSEIVDGSIDGSKLAPDAVGSSQIAMGAVGSDEIEDASIVDADISFGASIGGSKVIPDFGLQDVTTSSDLTVHGTTTLGNSSYGGPGSFKAKVLGDTGTAYLGARGDTDFDGLPSADWSLWQMAVVGYSRDTTVTPNFGVLGHSDGVGVRGEHLDSPNGNYGELGGNGFGIHAAGTVFAADLDGDVDIDGDLTASGSGSFDDPSTVQGLGTSGVGATGLNGPTGGYLGVQGGTDFAGVTSADWQGYEIGVVGLSSGASSVSDNYGVMGHSNGVGVRGQNAFGPTTDYAELGLAGLGLRAAGSIRAADFLGDVDVAGDLDVSGVFDVAGTFEDVTISTGSGRALDVIRTTSGSTAVVSMTRTAPSASGNDLLQLVLPETSHIDAQYIEAESGDIDFRVNRDGDVTADGTFSPGGADYAEMIEVSTGALSVEAGDVLVISLEQNRSVELSSEPHSRLVAGVYSTKPGVLGSEREWDEPDPFGGDEAIPLNRADMAERYDEIPLAVVGIVPAKVCGQNGPITRGDLLVTSSVPGHAMVDNDAPNGTVLGKALEPFSGTTGTIKILVTLQ